VINVPDIELKFLLPVEGVAAVYLHPSGQAWSHIVSTALL
jgi:hypothetical protein